MQKKPVRKLLGQVVDGVPECNVHVAGLMCCYSSHDPTRTTFPGEVMVAACAVACMCEVVQGY